jgi:hypothetical protein
LPPEFINKDFNLNNNKKSVFHNKLNSVGLNLDHDDVNHSNNGSVIMNSSDLEVKQE